jgi:hypothetical protein
MIWVAISWCSAGSVFTVNARNTASDYVDILDNQVHPMVQMLFPNNNAVFQDDYLPIRTAKSVQSWFEEHKDALQHLPGQHNHQTYISSNYCGQFQRVADCLLHRLSSK